MSDLLKTGQPPYIKTSDQVRLSMLDVIVALMPCLIAGVYFFGYRALVLTAISVGGTVASEHLWCVAFRKNSSVGDLSAVVSGILLALILPVTAPLWVPVVGSVFTIIIVKMCFGGLGQNFMNPALAGRAFLLASFPAVMTKWTAIFPKLHLVSNVDAVSSATPLVLARWAGGSALPGYLDLFLGGVGGCIGETSALAILIGAAYLFARRVINWRMPLVYIATVAFFGFLLGGKGGLFTGDALYHCLAGGALFAAVFMVTDYTTSPVTPMGQVYFAFGAGLITSMIRIYGGYPEGVTYGILLMNITVPLLEKMTPPRRFGGTLK